MTRGRADTEAERIIDALFAAAERERRQLSADELMRAIGLKRTSINSTYAHVNERRKRHNDAIFSEDQDPQRPGVRAKSDTTKLRAALAELRREIAAEQRRSEEYAKVIRRLTLENHQLRHDNGDLIDARKRFGKSISGHDRP